MDKKLPRYLQQQNDRWYFRPRGSARAFFGFSSECLGPNRDEACRQAAELIEQWDAHRRLKSQSAPAIEGGTLAWLIDQVLRDPVWFRSKAPTYRVDMEHHLSALRGNISYGQLRVKALRRKHIKAIYNEQLSKTTRSVANKRLKFLVRVLNYAVKELEILDHNPAAGIEHVKDESRGVTWTPDEVSAAIRTLSESGMITRRNGKPMPYAAHPEIALAVAIAYDTTLAQGDVLALKWDAWDGTGFAVEQIKDRGQKQVYCPVSDETRKLVEDAMRGRKSPYIIVDASGRPYIDKPGLKYRRRPATFGRLFRHGCERAGVVGKTFHDLRRTGLTEYGNSEATEAELSKIGGHAIGSRVIDVYVKPDKGAAITAAKRRWAKRGEG